MSGPVDVLAVMGSAQAIFDNIRFERRHESTELQTEYWSRRIAEMIAARAAVAKLIEADLEYDAALTELSDLNRRIAEHGWIEVEHDALRKAGRRLVHAQSRRHAALANVGSAS